MAPNIDMNIHVSLPGKHIFELNSSVFVRVYLSMFTHHY